MNRPDRRNGLSAELNVDLLDCLERAASDSAVRVVILTGAGSSFCVGADLTDVGNWETDVPRQTAIGRARPYFRAALLLHDMPDRERKLVYFTGIDGARFRRVEPVCGAVPPRTPPSRPAPSKLT